MRLALQTGETSRALELMRINDRESAIPSIHGEHIATQGLCLAVTARPGQALAAAKRAEAATSAVEVRVLAQGIRAIVGAASGEADQGLRLLELATQLGAWDPVVVRSARLARPLTISSLSSTKRVRV